MYSRERIFKLCADPLLARHASHRIRTVFLNLWPEDIFHDRNLVTEFLCNVLKRGVLDFEVRIICSDQLKTGYSLPFEVFTCKTVVEMRLGPGFVIQDLPENASLPSLKTLCLDAVQFNSSIGGCVFARLLSACPVLEELVMYGFLLEQWKWSRVVSSLTLKRLTIQCQELNRGDWYDLETISLDTPSLSYLYHGDIVPFRYPVVNLSSLVEAHLNLVQHQNNIDPTNLIKGLKHVQLLTLDHVNTVQLFENFREAVPMFENLTHLSVATSREACWDALKVLLKKSPNLKSLTITWLHYGDEDMEDVCECLLGYSIFLSLEVLKITFFEGAIGEMAQVKHILEKLPCLELLEVRLPIFGIEDEKKLQIK